MNQLLHTILSKSTAIIFAFIVVFQIGSISTFAADPVNESVTINSTTLEADGQAGVTKVVVDDIQPSTEQEAYSNFVFTIRNVLEDFVGTLFNSTDNTAVGTDDTTYKLTTATNTSTAIYGDNVDYEFPSRYEAEDANVEVASGAAALKDNGEGYVTNEIKTVTTNDNAQIDTRNWGDIDNIEMTDETNGQDAFYAVSFDDRGIWKIFDWITNTWRSIVKKPFLQSWKYNEAPTLDIDFTDNKNMPAQGVVAAGVSDSGLVGYWPLNGNADDVSGNGNDGTVNGGMGFAGGNLQMLQNLMELMTIFI